MSWENSCSPGNIVGELKSGRYPMLQELSSALFSAHLENYLGSLSDCTVLCPTDLAFARLAGVTADLKNHIIPGNIPQNGTCEALGGAVLVFNTVYNSNGVPLRTTVYKEGKAPEECACILVQGFQANQGMKFAMIGRVIN
jgi:hypothetical protein